MGNFRMARLWNEFVVSMYLATKSLGSFSPSNDMIRERLYQMIVDSSVAIEILGSSCWTMDDQRSGR